MAQIIHDVDLPNTGDGDPLRTAFIHQNEMNTELYETKVDKITGQGLSENNFTDDLKDKLDGIEDGAEVNVQSDWNQSDNTADDYIKNKPETFISYPYKGNFPHAGSNVFTMPDGVAVLDVRPCGAGSFIGWSQLGTTLTFTDYTLQTGDYLIVIGIYNASNIFSPLGGVSSVTDDGNTVVEVDNSDPLNPVITFEGVITDGATIGGSGTLLDPLNVIGGGGGGGGTWGTITGTLSDQTDLQATLDLKSPKNNPTFTGSVVVPNATLSTQAVNLSQLDLKLTKVSTGSQERVYGVGVDNVQKMISTKEQFVSDADIITALNAITTTVATISVVGKTMYKGQMYVSTSPDYLYVAFDDNLIIRK